MPELRVNFLLFDLDGTLVNSNPAVEQIWSETVSAHNTLYPENVIDLKEFLHSSHGARTVETFKKWFPYRSADSEAIAAHEQRIVSEYGLLATEVPGATPLLQSVVNGFARSWAIVTSGTTPLATGWVKTLFGEALIPPVFVTADLVEKGKPDPEGYRKAFETLRCLNDTPSSSTAVVFEDAPTGIAAGVAAGFPVIGLSTTFPRETLLAAGASYVIDDLTSVKLAKVGDLIVITI